jgi:hypothetical protein
MPKVKFFYLLALLLFINGCAEIMEKMEAAKPANYQRSNLTFGMVKKNLIKGQTTQSEILSLFGAPNITTKNKSGEEVWTYDKIAVTQEDVAAGFAIVGGGPVGAGLIGGAAGASSSNSSTSSRSITLLITFDEKDIVKDYAVMAQEF